MKKIIASTLAVVVFNIFSPVTPLAHAGTIENQLTQVLTQEASVARIQQLQTAKEQFEQGNRQGLIEALTKATFNEEDQDEAANIANSVSQGNLSQVAENALRQQVAKSITGRIAPYEKQLTAITTLFNN